MTAVLRTYLELPRWSEKGHSEVLALLADAVCMQHCVKVRRQFVLPNARALTTRSVSLDDDHGRKNAAKRANEKASCSHRDIKNEMWTNEFEILVANSCNLCNHVVADIWATFKGRRLGVQVFFEAVKWEDESRVEQVLSKVARIEIED